MLDVREACCGTDALEWLDSYLIGAATNEQMLALLQFFVGYNDESVQCGPSELLLNTTKFEMALRQDCRDRGLATDAVDCETDW